MTISTHHVNPEPTPEEIAAAELRKAKDKAFEEAMAQGKSPEELKAIVDAVTIPTAEDYAKTPTESTPIEDMDSEATPTKVLLGEVFENAKPNANLTSEVLEDKADEKIPAVIYIPGADQKVSATRNLEYYEESGGDLEKLPMQSQLHANAIEEALTTRMANDLYFDTSVDPAREWHQNIRTENGGIGARRPKFDDVGVKVTGQRAVTRVRSFLNSGGQIVVPLIHSGFYATFDTPDEDSLLAFYHQMTNVKVNLGRKLFGAALINEASYMNKLVLDFAVEWLADTNLTTGKEGFLENLSSLDIPHVTWGLACSIYQNGFNFARPVITEDRQETFVQSGKINVSKLQWIDTNSLTESQKRHMGNPKQRVSPESLAMYKAEFKRGGNRVVELSDRVRVTLRVPSATEHIDSGYAWIEGISEFITENFQYATEAKRNEYISTQSKATLMRQFDHFVESVAVLNPITDNWENYERDEENTVQLILNDLSKDDDLRAKFFSEIKRFIDDSTVAIIAVPAYNATEEKLALPRFEMLFPIDAVAVFLLLLVNRAMAVTYRSN